MIEIKIKPLSVNEAWQGRRFKTAAYHLYCLSLTSKLPKLKIPEGKLSVHLIFGFSNKLSDIDNPVKPVLDILQAKYKFNDRDIYRLLVEKEIVELGNDFIEFEVKNLDMDNKLYEKIYTFTGFLPSGNTGEWYYDETIPCAFAFSTFVAKWNKQPKIGDKIKILMESTSTGDKYHKVWINGESVFDLSENNKSSN